VLKSKVRKIHKIRTYKMRKINSCLKSVSEIRTFYLQNTNFSFIMESEREVICMNKKTLALTKEQYTEIIETIRTGFLSSRPNNKIATALVLEANLGIRISDIVQTTDKNGNKRDGLKLKDIVKDGGRYRLNIVEQKTQKERTFTVPTEIYNYIKQYCIDNEIKSTEPIFTVSERAVQKHLKLVCDYLGYEGIGTHSFRKFFATNIYKDNNYNILLVQELLQHSSPTITQRYIGISTKELETALQKNINLL